MQGITLLELRCGKTLYTVCFHKSRPLGLNLSACLVTEKSTSYVLVQIS